MRSCRSLLIAPGLFGLTLACGFAGCGSPDRESSSSEAGAGGERDRGAQARNAVGEAGSSGAGGASSGAAGGGAGGEADLAGVGGAGGEGGEAGAGSRGVCDATVADLPDDEFLDTNCDGIDGDAAHAVFVAPTGDDSAAGTLSAPVRSLNKAIALAASTKSAVYVCDATYKENVFVEQGVSIYGGFNCARGWAREKDRAIVLVETGLPLTIDSVTEPVLIDRLAFRAASAAMNNWGASSQAAAINNSTKVVLSHVELTAGDGERGVPGAPGADAEPAPPPAGGAGSDTILQAGACGTLLNGETAAACLSRAPGGAGTSIACAFNGGFFEVEGGNGGNGANWWLTQDAPQCLATDSEAGALGGTGHVRVPGRGWSALARNRAGRAGAPGRDGAGASAGIGSLRNAVYRATNSGSNGTWGEPGMPGFGGNGGPSSTAGWELNCYDRFTPGSGGGQGGVGGCGGGPASGGGGGGGSIALAIVNSGVELNWVSIATGRGGNGGAGETGGKGQPGGAAGVAGAAADAFRGADGQPGGEGGLGGASGPGGGGPSIGILYVGTAPKVSEGTFDIGVPGNGGALASGGAAPVGVTGELHQLAQ
ncbi:MAG: hypothetical protein ACOY0T_37620 [Myxococcota bacterium]